MFTALKRIYLNDSIATKIVKIVIASIIFGLSANAKLQIGLVPFTLQTVAISVVAYAIGSRLAVCSVLFYILQGIVGLPVFASGVGISAVLGPSGGFIIGFIPLAYLMGLASDRKISNFVFLGVWSIFANVILFAFGLTGLSFFVPFDNLLEVGLYPFILPGILKAIIAAAFLSPACKYFDKL